MLSAPILAAATASLKSDLRKRAMFYHLGGLVLADGGADAIALARLAINEAFQLDGLPDTAMTRDIVLACGALRSGFEQVGDELQATNPSVVRDCFVAGLLGIEPAGDGLVKVIPKIPMGEILSDGIAITSAGGTLRSCPWCQNLFAPIRISANFCRDACRSSHKNKTDRDARARS